MAGCVFAEEEAHLLTSEAQTMDVLAEMVDRRSEGVPLEHVIGWVDFCGVRIVVDQGVFVPRRRTEFLVHQAAAYTMSDAIVVDLCCGTGAVGVALSRALGNIELHAIDIDPASVQCARRNVTPVGGQVYEGNLYNPLPTRLQGSVDVLVANAPYVPTKAIELLPQEARLYESMVALDGGADGLNILRQVVTEASIWLAPGGHLLVETSERQALQTVEIFVQNGLISKVANCNELDATVVIGTKQVI